MEEVKKQGMESLFVPYEIALDLKELGFDEENCFGRWTTYPDGEGYLDTTAKSAFQGQDSMNRQCLAPLYQQVFGFFREKYDLVCIMAFDDDVKGKWFGNLYGHYKTHGKYDFGYTELFKTYEEAELECLKKLIEIVKEKK